MNTIFVVLYQIKRSSPPNEFNRYMPTEETIPVPSPGSNPSEMPGWNLEQFISSDKSDQKIGWRGTVSWWNKNVFPVALTGGG